LALWIGAVVLMSVAITIGVDWLAQQRWSAVYT
jgi:hypothetical protein